MQIYANELFHQILCSILYHIGKFHKDCLKNNRMTSS